MATYCNAKELGHREESVSVFGGNHKTMYEQGMLLLLLIGSQQNKTGWTGQLPDVYQ